MKKILSMTALGFWIVLSVSNAYAYTCPKGTSPVINQAGKQSGCR